jgi:hypothetical protein
MVSTFDNHYVSTIGENDKALRTVRDLDIRLALTHLSTPLPPPLSKSVEILQDPQDIRVFLDRIIQKPPACLGYDYECTGLKLDAARHRIVSLAIAPSPKKAWAFKWDNQYAGLWKKIMAHPMKKVAHNKAYENRCELAYFGMFSRNCECTAVMAHLSDNRQGFTALDDQAWLRFGFPSWEDGEIKLYKEPSKQETLLHGSNGMNSILTCPAKKLLTYNGIDAIATRSLYDWYLQEDSQYYE